MSWIPELVKFWITQCDIVNKKHEIAKSDMDAINNVFPHNFCIMMARFTPDNFITEYNEAIIKTNAGGIPRIKWYEQYFMKCKSLSFSFSFVYTHLDIFLTSELFDNLNIICFAPSTYYNDRICIPILDPYNFWESKSTTVYNAHYDLKFNNTPFSRKIHQVAWRGQNCPTFTREGLLTLRKNMVDKWKDSSHFDIGFTPFMDYHTFTSYKYIINVDGYGASFDGSIWKLRSSSLVIWITDESSNMYCIQWYFPLLKPFIHYVPSSIDKLEDTFLWCESHPSECINIIKNANLLIKDILENTHTYHEQLFGTINTVFNKTK